MRRLRRPAYRFWIAGAPLSQAAEKKARYVAQIQSSARAAIARPMRSHRLDVEIVFAAKNRTLRADVDNIAKPILDALKSIAYDDDRQVRSIRVVALPLDDAYGIRGRVDGHTMSRLLKTDEFLVNIYNGLHLDLDLVELVSSPERADS